MAQLVHRPCHWFPALFLLWMAPGYMGLYFYAQDYASWVANVVVFRKTTVVKSSGWLEMNLYVNYTIGRALYPKSFQMQNYTNGSLSSFNTSFVFSMNTSLTQANYGDGLTFLMCPSRTLGADQVASGGYLGLFNNLTVGKPENKVFAVEFDTRIYLNEGKKVVCWVDYDGQKRYLRVYVAYSPSDKPLKPALNWALDLAPYTNEYMYVGFTSATGIRYEQHRVYSWWFLSGFGNLSSPLASSSTSNFTPSSTSSSTPSSTSSSTPSSPSSSTPSSTSSSTPSSPSSSTSSSPSSSTPSSTSSSTPSSPSSSTPSPPSSFTPSSPSSSTPSPPSSFTPSSSSSGASSKSSSLLARLGQKKIVIGVFSSTLVISFLFFCCICAWCQWRRRSKHFIDILLPVACWMLWKETITSETRSTRCLKLLTPTVELLAWLWRTRSVRI
ncbi:hypothetical protein KP509_1Z072600 [Ceratopteris richardii]|nr:hypothetical protein KP509_1Z072600 [Ceratopteris richardii]